VIVGTNPLSIVVLPLTSDHVVPSHNSCAALGSSTEPEIVTRLELANGEVQVSLTDPPARGTISNGPLAGAAIHSLGDELESVYPASVWPLPVKLLENVSDGPYDHSWAPYCALDVTSPGWLQLNVPATAGAAIANRAPQAAIAERHPISRRPTARGV
jgi:hypothetical protein